MSRYKWQFISFLDDKNLLFKMQIICEHITPFEAYPLKTTEWKVQANQTRCLLDRAPSRLFILRGPTCLTPQVDLSSHQYPQNGLLAGFGGFTLTSSFRVNKKSIYMLQGPRIKTLPNCSLRLREYKMTRNPKRGRKSAFIYVEGAKAKNNMI